MENDKRGIQSIEVGGQLLRALVRSGEPMMLRDSGRSRWDAASESSSLPGELCPAWDWLNRKKQAAGTNSGRWHSRWG